jgi:hypothetical protein
MQGRSAQAEPQTPTRSHVARLEVCRSFLQRIRRESLRRQRVHSVARTVLLSVLVVLICALGTLVLFPHEDDIDLLLVAAMVLTGAVTAYSWSRVRHYFGQVGCRNVQLKAIDAEIAAAEEQLRERKDLKPDEEGEPKPPFDRARVRRLEEDREDLDARVDKQLITRNLFTALLLMVAATGAALSFVEDVRPRGFVGLLVASIVLIAALQITRERARELEADRRQIDYESAVVASPIETKAETLFLKQQFEVKRYYDQALNQAAAVFAVGVMAMLIGAGVAAGALVVIANHGGGVAAAVGAVGGLASNLVAAVYLRMHARALDTVREFHKRLVRHQSVHFGNLLANEIANREHVLEELALRTLDLEAEHPWYPWYRRPPESSAE